MNGYFIDGETQEVAIGSRTNGDGVTFEPWTDGDALGFIVTEASTGRRELVALNPTDHHEFNEDNESTADTFLYSAELRDGEEASIDAAEPVTYLNHFAKDVMP